MLNEKKGPLITFRNFFMESELFENYSTVLTNKTFKYRSNILPVAILCEKNGAPDAKFNAESANCMQH